MPAKVFFLSPRSRPGKDIFSNLERLLEIDEFSEMIREWKMTGIKLHFGEERGWGYIHPKFVKVVNARARRYGSKTFLTDTCSVYLGSRSDAVGHIETAMANGFDYVVSGAPIIIADGLKGASYVKVPVNLSHFKEVDVAREITQTDGMICMSHFKGHELCGFGGAIKNIGMGLAARSGKLAIHSSVSPYIKKGCVGCGVCVRYCCGHAIYLKEGRAYIDQDRCVGCGQCIISCPNAQIKIRWDEPTKHVQEKICEYAYAVLKVLNIRMIFLNFLIHITPECDCCNYSDTPICPDLGVLASTDIVAVDQASVDLINKSQGIQNSALAGEYKGNTDKFRTIYPEIDWEIQLDYAQTIGLGSREHELIPFA